MQDREISSAQEEQKDASRNQVVPKDTIVVLAAPTSGPSPQVDLLRASDLTRDRAVSHEDEYSSAQKDFSFI